MRKCRHKVPRASSELGSNIGGVLEALWQSLSVGGNRIDLTAKVYAFQENTLFF